MQVGGEPVVAVQTGDDGWIQVLYPDGDLVWTPPEAVTLNNHREEAMTETANTEDTSTNRSKAYSAATARLREAHRTEFDTYLTEEMGKFGLVYKPKPTEAQKAEAEIRRLLAAHPELRNLFAIGNDPANDGPQDSPRDAVQAGAVQRSDD
jgi:hypothetical protein